MTATSTPIRHDSRLDLVLERVLDVPKDLVWRAYTDPEQLKKWFVPAPWSLADCEVDLRPGGIFRTVMRSPEGQEFAGAGCYLEVVPGEKLVWTSALAPGFRPAEASEGALPFTAVILLEAHGTGTKYTAIAMHGDEAACKRHADMGFLAGWGATLDQLVAMAKG